MVARCIYMLWLGDEELNETRINAIKNMPPLLIYITKQNLHTFILAEFPLHPAYEYLSTVHKSDYMRCYMMHHYGGGYSDIKTTHIDWIRALDVMDANENIQLMGVKTIRGHLYAGIETWSESLKNDILQNMDKLACMGYMICRPYSTITTKWYNELHKRLDEYLHIVKENPATYTRECFDPHLGYALSTPSWEGLSGHSMYPISWNLLLSQILYPIQLLHIDAVNNTTMIHIF